MLRKPEAASFATEHRFCQSAANLLSTIFRGDYNQGIGYRLRAAELFRGFSNYYLLDVLGRQLSQQQLALRVGTTTLPVASDLAAGGIFTLKTTGLPNIGNVLAVSAVNQLGQMVYCQAFSTNTLHAFNLSALGAGLYHVRVACGNEVATRSVAIGR